MPFGTSRLSPWPVIIQLASGALGGLDLSTIIRSIAGGGGVLMAIIGLIKKALVKKA